VGTADATRHASAAFVAHSSNHVELNMLQSFNLEQEATRFIPDMPALPHLRRSALATWRGRMINEYSSSVVFEGLALQMRDAGMDPSTVLEVEEFAREEKRHGAQCAAVVTALGGVAVGEMRQEENFPMHHDAKTKIEGVLRNVLSIACLSETVAVALIGAERIDMPEGSLRSLLTQIYKDEVGHSRFGWRMLERNAPQLDLDTKARLGEYLRVAFAHLETHELAHLNPDAAPPEEGAALGLCNGQDARELFYDTIREVIIPGLEAHGIPAKKAFETRRA
jgi:hypothetical protein